MNMHDRDRHESDRTTYIRGRITDLFDAELDKIEQVTGSRPMALDKMTVSEDEKFYLCVLKFFNVKNDLDLTKLFDGDDETAKKLAAGAKKLDPIYNYLYNFFKILHDDKALSFYGIMVNKNRKPFEKIDPKTKFAIGGDLTGMVHGDRVHLMFKRQT